jgi:hypothetical protein
MTKISVDWICLLLTSRLILFLCFFGVADANAVQDDEGGQDNVDDEEDDEDDEVSY